MSIEYNNVDFEQIAPVKIEDIVVTPIQMNPVARQRPVQFGAEFMRIVGGERTVTITFALLDQDINNRELTMQNIRDWAFSTTEKTLHLPMFANKHLECICTQLPDHTYRKWWENKLRVQFTCFDNPYWTSDELVEVAAGTAFSVGGSAPPLMTIEYSGSRLTNQAFTSRTESMTFTQIPAGDLVIDLNRQTAAIGKTSIMQYYTTSSTWIVPKIGANQLINGVGAIKYRERWV